MKVVIIGSGNVATVLGRKIAGAGHEIVQVFGRNEEKLRTLCSYLKTTYTSDMHSISRLGDIYILAVSDASINPVVAQLHLGSRLLVHTAGSVSKDVLSNGSSCYGVLYPLQTLNKDAVSLPAIPILIDGNSGIVTDKIREFASTLSDNVTVADDEERLKLHLAAVFVNNFPNHLLVAAARYCLSNGLQFRLLEPIIKETILRVEANDPADMQTGPAIREDFETIARHQGLLTKYPEMLHLYNCMTDSIIAFYKGSRNSSFGG